ncbi:MAG: arsenate reductase (glutaredoxin) [Methylomonas sp.]|nr:MAG: arsenate reductase (glutaredoxin) [Methylomonas sp.]PPD27843.1 MAG: arsenate reductase (glutaredoxin) [Methylomonas sp.]PPD39952.1 MAG: arsenate reductase (glutaredoxin) [Methylomonas sp.]PPD41068.1 MAG: arsenate reductase (glutaredoxin) [Methylomonas sp.]PPD52054.1 MAG: arsenate reductase (glutaredoxin) [Methylomonas sp.]
MTVKIYHNPRCSKSRETLKLLEAQGVTADVVHYLETPPSHAELQAILDMLGIGPRELMRRKEPEYQANGLDDPSLTDSDLIEAMVRVPKLIERPIVISNGRAAIGRPAEQVLPIL